MTKLCFSKLMLVLLFAFTMFSCSDDDNNGNDKPAPNPKEQWGKTMKGNGEELGAYPDLYSNYWEFTYNTTDSKDKIICLKGEYPHCRYFSLSLYNDETGTVINGLDDAHIQPDAGSQNPFVKTVAGKNYFTIYIVPSGLQQVAASLPSKNVIVVSDSVNRVALALRQYLGTTADGSQSDEYGGVELPAISALNAKTLKATDVPKHVASNIYNSTSQVFTQVSDEDREMPFFLAPVGRYYPNYSTAYLYARTHVHEDEVLTFSFIPAPVPTKSEEYANAVTRYWSICLGSAGDTRSYMSLCDRNARYQEGQKSEFVVCLKKNPRLAEIKAKVDSANAAGGLVNLFVWDSEKINIDNQPIGEVIAVMYRNILPDKNWEYSIANMEPTEYKDETGDPIDHVTNPEKQLAHVALKDYGPLGTKISTEEFLNQH